MRFLRDWSLLRVLMASAGWILVASLLGGLGLIRQAWKLRMDAASTGSGGVGAVFLTVNVVVLLILLGPPLILLVSWLVIRLP